MSNYGGTGFQGDLGFDPNDYTRRLRGYGGQSSMGSGLSLNPAELAVRGGGSILGAISEYLGGGQDRKDQRFGREQLRGMIGRDVFNPHQIAGQRKLSFMANAKPMAESANRHLGLDSGRAWQELLYKYGNQEGDFLSELMLRNRMAAMQRDLQIGSQFYQAGR